MLDISYSLSPPYLNINISVGLSKLVSDLLSLLMDKRFIWGAETFSWLFIKNLLADFLFSYLLEKSLFRTAYFFPFLRKIPFLSFWRGQGSVLRNPYWPAGPGRRKTVPGVCWFSRYSLALTSASDLACWRSGREMWRLILLTNSDSDCFWISSNSRVVSSSCIQQM